MANVPIVRSVVIEQQGAQNFIHPAGWCDAVKLLAGAEQKYDFTNALAAANGGHAKAVYVVFSANNPFYVDFNGNTAAVPTASTTNGGQPVYSPNQRYLNSEVLAANVNKISLIAAADTIVTMEIYTV